MPRYFFDVHDGTTLCDDYGRELPGLMEARKEALRYAGDLISDLTLSFWAHGDLRMEVKDEDGLILFMLMFATVDGAASGKELANTA